MKVKIISHTIDPDKTIAAAAKLCYSRVGVEEITENLTEESTEKFLNRLMS
ncbi:MAG: FAD-dependent thymidylate synthase, partial [Peptoniphilus sp.]